MSTVTLQLRQEDARLVFLAVAYHLGRPGPELDPDTKLPVEHGLAETASELQPQLAGEEAFIRLSSDQAKRLLSGMLGSISELKAYHMMRPRDETGRRSIVPGFDRSLTHLFPEVAGDPEESLGVAERMLMLKRRLDDELAVLLRQPDQPPASSQSKRKGWWPFGSRS